MILAGLVVAVASGDEKPPAEVVAQGAGLNDGPPPWPPDYDNLPKRLAELNFPPGGDESYHVHTLLSVYVDGKAVTVPANIGIDPRNPSAHSSLHTHTPDGVVHMEADEPYPYKLPDILAIWGVDLEADRLGGLQASGTKVVQVYANGELVADPSQLRMNDGDNIVIGFGEPGSFPIEPPDDALRQT